MCICLTLLVMIMQVPFASALAVQSNGQIAAVGSTEKVLKLQQAATNVADLGGAFVLPVYNLLTCIVQLSIKDQP